MSGKAGMTSADRRVLKGIAVLLLGMVLLLHGCSRFLLGGGPVLGAEVAEGTVVEVRTETWNRGRGDFQVKHVYVEYPIGDRRVRVRDQLGATGDDPKMGDRVPVYFDPRAPETAMVGGNERMTGMQYLAEWLAGIAMAVGAVVLIIRAGRLKKREARAIEANAKEGTEAT